MPQIPVAPSPDKRRCTNDGRKETRVDRAGRTLVPLSSDRTVGQEWPATSIALPSRPDTVFATIDSHHSGFGA
jgi:hypothetical protein